MILVAKHLVLMSFALLLVPICGLFFAKAMARRQRMVRPRLTPMVCLLRIFWALLIPALAQGLFALFGDRWPLEARYLALGLVGLLYGATFGNGDDFPPVPTAFWGLVGGVWTAWLYAVLPTSGEGRAFCVAIFAVLPILGYRPLAVVVRNRLTTSGLIVPNRRLLR